MQQTSYSRSKLGGEDNAFGYCQNNNDDSDIDGNSGDDNIYVDNLV